MVGTQLFLFILLDSQIILALFVVTAPKSIYTAQYGDTVEMICNFPVPKEDDLRKLKVSWKHVQINQAEARQVTIFSNGREDVLNQEKTYKGRASLVIQELKNGAAILNITEVKLSDAGTYLCLLQLGGSDYQEITLNVQASYSRIVTYSNVSEEHDISLTCESVGFPEAEVYWKKDGVNVSSSVNTSQTRTTDGLYKVISTLKGVDVNHYYQCEFWNKALNEMTEASLKHSGHVELLTHGSNYPQKNDSGHHSHTVIIISIIGCIAILLIVMVILHLKKRHWCFKCFKKKGTRAYHQGSGKCGFNRKSPYLSCYLLSPDLALFSR
ncbi:programmed cell death 1 ligand 1-like [Leptodactylus fuscus]|uniref:programmed cell death 1 ligand 1-like n=1 Tax=Leptodactylus fuscus TaxID=238119 RepID=UPI003F4ED625